MKIEMPKKSRPTIGLLTFGAEDPNNDPLWNGVYDVARARGANLLCFPGKSLHSSKGFDAQANILYDLIERENLDGLVGWGARLTGEASIDDIKVLFERYYPMPIVNAGFRLEGIPSVRVDNYSGMYDVVAHLIEKHDCRQIAFIGGPKENPEAKERYRAYTMALAKSGISVDDNLVVFGDWSQESGEALMSNLLDERASFKAVVAANDTMARGVMKAMQRQGIRVPTDVAVVGFDDVNESRYSIPPLTTVRQSFYEMGKRAAEMLLELLAGEKVPDQITLATDLVVRQSCGCPDTVVENAKADISTKAGAISKMALTARRESILSEMVKVVADSSIDNITERVDQLLNVFYTVLKGKSSETFLSTLDEILGSVALAGGAVSAWQEAISIMRRNTLLYIGDDQVLHRIEDLWQQARVVIGERAQQAEGYRRLQTDQQTAILNEINQALVTTSDEKDLMSILVAGLPRLNIRSCYVSLYENPVAPAEWCRLILAYRDGRVESEADEQRFPSQQLAPSSLLPQGNPYNLVVEPLYFRENQIGLALFEVGPREGMVYEAIRGQLSSALWGSRLVQYLKSLYKASSTIISLQEPEAILKDVVDQACKAVGAKWANIVLVDKAGRPQRLAVGGGHSNLLKTSALVSNEPVLIENLQEQKSAIYQQMAQEGAGASGCFPLHLRGKLAGSLWIFYEKPHHFSDSEVDALQLYATQAAIAYDNARRMKELEHLRQAAEKLASVAEVKDVLQQIVKSAREVLSANSAVIWSYDATRMAFLPSELVADGVDQTTLDKYREDEPRPDGTAATVFASGYLAVTNVDHAQNILGQRARGLRKEIGVKSFQGIALKVDSEPLGVLYVNYESSQAFEEEDRSTLVTFAYHAALALKEARMLEHVKKVSNSAKIVADKSVLENLQSTLDTIAKSTQEVLNCDVVTLYTYDQTKGEFGFPPAMVDVTNKKEVLKIGHVARDSFMYGVLEQKKLHVAEDAQSDPIIGGRPFVKREGIRSSMSIPLWVGDFKVGVMFVNYRTRHHFTDEEIADITLFAHQAAVAIRNAQLYDETVTKATYLQALYEAGKAVTSSLATDEILHRIVEQAFRITSKIGSEGAHVCYLALKENDELIFKAMYPPGNTSRLMRKVYVNLERDNPIGIVGRAAKTGESQLVNNVSTDPDYIKDELEIYSELAVPIKIGRVIIGVFDVEHPKLGAFDNEDKKALEFLAAQAAIAIQNAQRYEELEQTKGLVGARTALAWMGMAHATWGHTIDRDARNIEEMIDPLRAELERVLPSNYYSRVAESLSGIRRLARQIRQKPITPPLPGEEGTYSVAINSLIRERTMKLWQNEPYQSTCLRLDLPPDKDGTVRASPEWLRRLVDILIDNAVDAMADLPRREVTIATRQHEMVVEIRVGDTGRGIQNEVITKLFLEPIEKTQGTKGLGRGLLMAQLIAQTYGGKIEVESTSPSGTTMLVSLPLESIKGHR